MRRLIHYVRLGRNRGVESEAEAERQLRLTIQYITLQGPIHTSKVRQKPKGNLDKRVCLREQGVYLEFVESETKAERQLRHLSAWHMIANDGEGRK